MNIGLLTLEVVIPYAQSLKDKRQVIRSLRDRLKKFNVSIAECGHQDLWQRSTLGIVTISSDHAVLERTLQTVTDEAERILDGNLTQCQIEFL
ncbi:MAG: DUF503 domain-containing protein [Acidobacteria bacterium]|nr:DUF503 domain-containing protein [Acidobacteriota bacterium]